MNKFLIAIATGGLVLAFSSAGAQYFTPSSGEKGIAMYYADYLEGQATALGETYRKDQLTCSHPWLPKGTLLKVSRLDNGQSVTVRVNDRGTFQPGVILSLSFAAAMEIDLLKVGKAWVRAEQVGQSEINPVSAVRARSAAAPPAGIYGSEFTVKGVATYESVPAPAGYYGPMPGGSYGGYGIQLGAYGVYDNALRRQESLEKQGVGGISIKESRQTDGSRLYRVVVGAFASRADAENYLQGYLKANLLADGVVVQLR